MFKFVLASAVALLSTPVSAASYVFDLQFMSDNVKELHVGYDRRANCHHGRACYPTDFRLKTGFFADLNPGDRVTGRFDSDTGLASIAGWSVPGDLISATGPRAMFEDLASANLVRFNDLNVTVEGEGPAGANYTGYCDPDNPMPGLPAGYCGFFGYEAHFAVKGISEVPLPAGALLLISGLGALAATRKRRG
ncbi:MAG: VPLPA-CTERM sorting domain-containing protein [Silicimonas sp.]|nr:VPLPA-CTERM sorting domain-containing protein [Silicimonas sp.]